MRYSHSMAYEAEPAAVYAMLVDEEFQTRRAKAGDPVLAEAVVTRGPGDGAQVHVTREMVVDLPGMLGKLTGNRFTLREHIVWPDGDGTTGGRAGTLSASMQGQPGSVEGILRVTPTDSGTAVSLDADIVVRVPLVGAKIERNVAEMLDKLMRKEHELGRAWLSGAG